MRNFSAVHRRLKPDYRIKAKFNQNKYANVQ